LGQQNLFWGKFQLDAVSPIFSETPQVEWLYW